MNNWSLIAQKQQTAGKQNDLDQREDPPNPEAAAITPLEYAVFYMWNE